MRPFILWSMVLLCLLVLCQPAEAAAFRGRTNVNINLGRAGFTEGRFNNFNSRFFNSRFFNNSFYGSRFGSYYGGGYGGAYNSFGLGFGGYGLTYGAAYLPPPVQLSLPLPAAVYGSYGMYGQAAQIYGNVGYGQSYAAPQKVDVVETEVKPDGATIYRTYSLFK